MPLLVFIIHSYSSEPALAFYEIGAAFTSTTAVGEYGGVIDV